MTAGDTGATSLLHILEAYTKGIGSLNGSIDLLTSAMSQLPDGQHKQAIKQKIAEAKHALQLANAEIGQSLGFQLCQCTWPHQVMASIGYSEEDQLEQFECPNCKKVRTAKRSSKPSESITAFDPYDDY